MSPEQFHDALNYLDDDLIAQTDDLRQGKRVLQNWPAARKIVPWAAAAACLALVIGFGPRLMPTMESGNATNYGSNGMEQAAEQPNMELEDFLPSITGDSSRNDSSYAYAMREISHGAVSLDLADDWTYELESQPEGGYFVVIRPPHEEGALRIGYYPNFGVCGTGLTTGEMTLAGRTVRVGTYDDDHVWSFIILGDDFVVLNEGAGEWWGAYGDTAMAILDTIRIE